MDPLDLRVLDRRLPALPTGAAAALLTVLAGQAFGQSPRFTELLRAEGDGASDRFGSTVAKAGDLNGDGFADILIAARAGSSGMGSPSYVRALSGRSGAVLHEWSGLASTEGAFGVAIASAGDTNGDGVDDVLVGSPSPDPTVPTLGSVYLYSGSDGSLLQRWIETSVNDGFGRAVAGVGDIDGDGLADIAIGAPLAGNSRGVVKVYSPASGDVLRTFFGVAGEGLGASVTSLGDLDSDGTPDVLIGSPDGVAGSCPSCVRVYSGFDGTPLLTILDADEDSRLGADVAAPGDLTGDGIPDIVASAPAASITEAGDGAVYVFSGADGSVVFRWTDRQGGPFPSGYGLSVDSGGDVNYDGFCDVVVGAPLTKGAANGIERGRMFVYSGADGSLLFRVTGQGDAHRFGTSAAMVGDMNGDGFADVAAGAPSAIILGPMGERRSGQIRTISRVPENGGLLCVGADNSLGQPSTLFAASPSSFETSANDVELQVTDLPPGVPGFFIVSPDFNVIPLAGDGIGTLCIASSNIGRILLSFGASSPAGGLAYALDNTQIPLPSAGSAGVVAVLPGDQLNFQFWHRDAGAAGSPTSNFSGAITITFQ